MLDFQISHLGVYKKAERRVQSVNSVWIVCVLSGLRGMRFYDANDKPWLELAPESVPAFVLAVPGMKTAFEFDAKRENWTMMLERLPLRFNNGVCELECDGAWLPLPACVPIPPEKVSFWREELKTVKERLKEPTPLNLRDAKFGALGVLRFIAAGGELERREPRTPEERLKSLVDEDLSFERPLEDMAAECGLSADRLRQLFFARYQTNPKDYRREKRNAATLALMADSELSVKEIAARVGFKHVQHFCAEFRSQFGMTPKEGLRKFRKL